MSEEQIESAPRGIERRKVLKAAAWSAPVVALAVSAPAAVASASQALITSTGTATATPTNPVAGETATVTWTNTGLLITNISGSPWSTGALTAELTVVRNFTITQVRIAGSVVTATGGSYTSADGTVWTVISLGDALTLVASAVTIDPTNGSSQSVMLPVIELTGTYTGTTANSGQVTLSAYANDVSGGSIVGARFGAAS